MYTLKSQLRCRHATILGILALSTLPVVFAQAQSAKYEVRPVNPQQMKADAVITCLGKDMLTIMEKGSDIFDCPMERAQMIADRLNKVSTIGSAMMFEVRKVGAGYVIYMVDHMGMREHKTITVFPADVAAYRRSGVKHLGERYRVFAETKLDEEMLALYWRDLATDMQAVFSDGERPIWLVYTFCGKVLNTIYDRARRVAPEGPIRQSVFQDIFAKMSDVEKMHVGMITKLVPHDYNPRSRVVNAGPSQPSDGSAHH